MSTNNAINSPDIDGGTLTAATIATNDKIIIQDTSNGNRIATVTTQAVADLSNVNAVQTAFAYALVFGG